MWGWGYVRVIEDADAPTPGDSVEALRVDRHDAVPGVAGGAGDSLRVILEGKDVGGNGGRGGVTIELGCGAQWGVSGG